MLITSQLERNFVAERIELDQQLNPILQLQYLLIVYRLGTSCGVCKHISTEVFDTIKINKIRKNI